MLYACAFRVNYFIKRKRRAGERSGGRAVGRTLQPRSHLHDKYLYIAIIFI